MALISSGGSELTQLMTYHVLNYIYRDVLSAVVNGNGVTDEIREDGRGARPGLQNSLFALFIHFTNALIQFSLNEGAFFYASAHCSYPPLFVVTSLDDELVGASLLISGLITQSRLAPRSYRTGTADGSAALTTTMGVIAGVHYGTSNGGSDAHVTLLTGFTDLNVLMLQVTDGTDGCLAIQTNQTNLTGGEANLSHAVLFCHQLSGSTSGTNQLSASAGIDLDRVDQGTHGDVRDGKHVTWLNVSGFACVEDVANLDAVGSKNVALLPCFILEKCDVCGTVGVVLDSGNGVTVCIERTLEIDDSVLGLVAAAMMTNGNLTGVVAACLVLQSYKQAFLRLSFGQLLERGSCHVSE